MLIVTFFSSCSIEKRKYTDGFHVEWHHRHKPVEVTESKVDEPIAEVQPTVFNEKMTIADVVSDTIANTSASAEITQVEKAKPISPQQKRGIDFRSRNFLRQFITPVFESRSEVSAEVRQDISQLSVVGSTFGMIGLIFAMLAIVSLIIATLIAEGWAALGWIGIAVAFGVATLPFTAIAQGIFWYHHQGVPWFQWPGIVVSLMGIYVVIRILTGK